MGIPVKSNAPKPDISLDDKYCAETGRIFLNGTQALVRLPMTQMRRDRAAGLNTATYISGYRGSPIGSYDLALQAARRHLAPLDIHFQPGLNEDLAATAIWGSQGLAASPGARKEGVLGIWYGKGPGVDRSGDVLRHANSFGSARHGGVLALAGDDHHAKSSTVAHQSDHAFMSALMPMLFPSSVHEFIELGLAGIAMSRYSGLWVAFKLIADTIDTSTVIDLAQEQRRFVLPEDFEMPPGGLNNRWPDDRFAQDERLQEYKGYAAIAFARANHLDEVVLDSRQARFGIIASGKAFENVMEALRELAIDAPLADAIGLRVYKVRMPWPLEPDGVRHFSEGLEEVLVIEERREVIEHQIKQQLFNWRADVRPRIVGKFDDQDRHILSLHEDITTGVAVRAIAARLLNFELPEGLRERITRRRETYRKLHALKVGHKQPVTRLPHFCAGCPHNTSTQVPEGSRAFAGIGCHFMSLWMDRRTETYTHMGGEGVTWLGMAPFTDEKHVFTNLGDGTYFHSGILAIRQSVAAGVNITYKLLFNSAVAMTGGQPVDGPLTIPMLAQQLAAEGVAAIRLVTDDPQRYRGVGLADGVQVFHRECLDQVQRELRDIPGCTILVYDQTCATENRRQRKRGLAPDPDRRAFINPLVCEGCGDCSVQSNCIALEPLETPFGRKRRINQSACNKDFSCINGFCPAFVTLEGVVPRKAALPELRQQALPEPHRHPLDQPCNIAITGIGGTGVLTIGALIGMAAHIEGKSVILQDFSGLAQKGGAVVSHVRVSRADQPLHAPQIAAGEADLLLAADTVVAASTASINLYRDGRTRAILNTRLSPVSGFVFQRDFDFREQQVLDAIRAHVHPEVAQLDFGHLSERVCGDAIATTVMLLGYACQQGLLPVGPEALLQAIVLNGVAPDLNRRAFTWGRVFAEYPQQAAERLADAKPGSGLHSGVAGGLEGCATLAELMQQHETFLKAYQNQALADRYRSLVQQVQATETAVTRNDRLTRTVARQYFRLLAYKDEYEVARLYTSGEFENYLSSQFEGNLRTTFHLAPGWLAGRSLPNGRPRKRALGHWMFTAMKLLARMRFLRGTPLDPFGYQQERQLERGLPAQYEQAIGILCQHLNAGNFKEAQALADYTDDIRGFGPVKMAGIKTAEKRYEAALQAFLRTA